MKNVRVFVVNNNPSGSRFQDERDEIFIKEAIENGLVFDKGSYEEFVNEQKTFFDGDRPYPVVRMIEFSDTEVEEIDNNN
jgi:hypothetical protein